MRYSIAAIAAVVVSSATAQSPVLPQGARNILTYSSYLGGRSNDTVHAIAVDSLGNVYLTGETVSPDFPVTPGVLQSNHAGKPGNDCSIFTGCYLSDAFVTKLDPSGKIVYSTYLGGTSADAGYGIAVDASGNAYVSGTTSSPNFPVTAGAFQTTPLSASTHAFIAKLNPSGSALVYSTLVGGSGSESTVAGIRVDSSGSAYAAGTTTSLDFPVTPGALQTSAQASQPPNTLTHGFVVKLNSSGSALSYSTYLSGSQGAYPQAIALTSSGEILITGSTSSGDFPITAGAYQTTIPAAQPPFGQAASRFVSRLNAQGSALAYSTFFGGPPNSSRTGIDVDDTGAAYLTGDMIGNFPITPGAFVGPSAPAAYPVTVYAAKFSADGTHVIYAVPLAAGTGTVPAAIAVDAGGNVWLTGRTSIADFPITGNAYQSSYAGSVCFGALVGPFAGSGEIPDCGDAYLALLNPSGTSLVYSTYFGSNGGDTGAALAIAPDGSAYLAGNTESALLPATATAPQTHRSLGPDCTFQGSPSAFGSNICTDAFLARFRPSSPEPVLPFEIVNSASYLPGAVAPGELVTLFGPGIGPAEGLEHELDANGRIGTVLGGVQVFFDGTAAPLLYAGPNQLNLVVPYDTASKTQVRVRIAKGGAPGPEQNVAIAKVSAGFTIVAPGVFGLLSAGAGQAAAFNNAEGTPNGPDHPAAPGSIVGIYVTGLGVTDQTVSDGTITEPSVLPLNSKVEVFVGGKSASVLYAGAAPYSVAGVSQVNFVVPSGLPSGNQAVFVSAGHVQSSQSGLWIAIQ